MIKTQQEQVIEIKPKPTLDTSYLLREANEQGQILLVNRYQVEQDAIFINYQHTELLITINKYKASNFYWRMCLAKHILQVRSQIRHEAYEQYKSFILAIARDPAEEIRKVFLESLQEYIKIIKCKSIQTSIYTQLQQILIPTLLILLKNENLDIKQDASKLIASILPIIKTQNREQFINNEILNFIKQESEESKLTGVNLIIKSVKFFPKESAEKLILKQIFSLGDSQFVRVKKQIVLGLPETLDYISYEFFENKLIEFYVKKCQENSWMVRKSCVVIIYDIYKYTNSPTIKEKLESIFLQFLKDGNKLVRIQAHKKLPIFITSIIQKNNLDSIPTSLLISQYFKLVDNEINNQVTANQILESISYTFPAVLLGFGQSKWKQLSTIYQKLFKNHDKNIRIPLGSSLHQVAKLLGTDKTKNSLIIYLDSILKDHCEQLKLCTIEHLSEFVSVFNDQIKQNLIDVFLVLQKDPRKWRIRYLIASQISKLARIYDYQNVFRFIIPISFKLCIDPVSDIRRAASQNIWIFLEVFQKESAFIYVVLETIKEFGISHKYYQRQSFLMMCKGLWKFEATFQKQIIPLLLPLATDKVIVRILLAQLINLINEKYKNNVVIKQIVEILQKDSDEDVLNALHPE